MARNEAATKRLEGAEAGQLLNEVAGVVALAAAIFALVSFLSFAPDHARNQSFSTA